MPEHQIDPPSCPRCGSNNVSVCGKSIQFAPEERPDQPLGEREVHTLAYQCECGIGFTNTIRPWGSTTD